MRIFLSIFRMILRVYLNIWKVKSSYFVNRLKAKATQFMLNNLFIVPEQGYLYNARSVRATIRFSQPPQSVAIFIVSWFTPLVSISNEKGIDAVTFVAL